MTTAKKPNPGSPDAKKAGCWCAVLDNNHGRFPVFEAYGDQPAGWWITEGCPVHAPGGDAK